MIIGKEVIAQNQNCSCGKGTHQLQTFSDNSFQRVFTYQCISRDGLPNCRKVSTFMKEGHKAGEEDREERIKAARIKESREFEKERSTYFESTFYPSL